jgi:hypothetical protein
MGVTEFSRIPAYNPSMVFLDDMSKWCLVLFLDNLPTEATQFLPKVQELGYLEIE